MLLYAIIILGIFLMIYIPWEVYRKTDNIGFAFIAFLFCVGATPFIAWIFFCSLLKE